MSKLTNIIYVGRCLETNKVYVGSTTKGKSRPLNHALLLNKGTHPNIYLQRTWDKYGEAAFTWHIVEECSKQDLRAREQWWIGFLRALDRRYGFNLCNPVNFEENVKSELGKTQVVSWKDPEIRRKRLTGLKSIHKDQKWKSRRKQALTERWQDKKWRAKMLAILANNATAMSKRMKAEPDFKKHRMRGIQPSK